MKWNIAPEYISLVFILILLASSRDNSQKKTLKSNLFNLFLWFTFFEILISILSIVAIENYLIIPLILNQVIQILYFLFAPLLSVLFTLYIIAVGWEGDVQAKRYMSIVIIPYAIYVPFVLTNPFTRLLYEISTINGFSSGKWFILTYFIHIAYVMAMFAIVLIRKRKMKVHLIQVLLSFPIISLTIIGIQIIFPKLILSGTLAAIVALIVYLYIQHEQKDTLKESEERFRNLFTLKGDALFVIDKTTNDILEVNESACSTYGYSRAEMLLLKSTNVSAEPEETDRAAKELTDKYIKIPLRYHKKKDGTVFPVELTVTAFTWDNKRSLLVGSKDITERRVFEEKLMYLSYHDQLTGLYNRRFFEEELIRLDTNRNLPITIAMGDVNGLKLINDSFGHLKGDQLLKRVAFAMCKACREDDIVTRLGGDEFAVILPKTSEKDAEKIVSRIIDLTGNEKIEGLNISISFGFQTKNTGNEDINMQMKEAEEKMYRHKINESSSMRNKTIELIMNTLFEKNEKEMEHSKRVSGICVKIATELGFAKDDINRLRTAGLMHDIGKIGIDEKILNSDHSLDNEEWVQIKKHPEIGSRILSSSTEFFEISVDVLQHHERWDGKGYPNGLNGEEISVKARIIALADTYDAMMSDRAYRKTFTRKQAIDEITRCSGTQFDPKIVQVFLKMIQHESTEI